MIAPGRPSPMQRVLCIPELLDIVFGLLDHISNTANAQVCKRWSHIALDSLWKDVDDLPRLFGILAPLRKAGTTEEYEFSELPDALHWKRFERYSSRVRRLVYNHPTSDVKQRRLRQSVFDDVARTRTKLNILPNMHTLVWKGPLNLSVMFMHGGMKNFIIWLPEELDSVSPQPFFQDVTARMPNLTNLNLRSLVAVHNFESDVVNLIKGLPKLHTITIPRWYLTTTIAETLSGLPLLGVIEFQYLTEQGCGIPEDVTPFSPSLSEGAFPTLWDFSLTASFGDVARFLDLQFAPTNLTSLYIDSEMIERASSIRHFISTIAENCQLLKFLALVSFRDPCELDAGSTHADSSNPEDYQITIGDLKPVLKLANLTSLEILHHYPLALKQEDVELLASSWPCLATLILNNEPVICSQSTLTLESLLPFARHCPKLTHLGMFLDASSVESPLDPKTTAALVAFKRLKRLSMGVSIITNDHPVSLYLSHILPLGCTVDCGITWDEDTTPSVRLFEIVQDRCEEWAKVTNLLPVLVKLRLEERERTRAMERELDDLRMRSGISGVRLDFSTCILI